MSQRIEQFLTSPAEELSFGKQSPRVMASPFMPLCRLPMLQYTGEGSLKLLSCQDEKNQKETSDLKWLAGRIGKQKP